ncbi:NAD(P)-dependent oxidoreductase [Metapseudomonas lalkuanensis]|uniref:NAD(P)-dependent oxidoreductase n=1 Tax=Metapseudomonas lalkuanensis TaxID=2604832 RepID=A0A5J6QQV3_9GAMM|nr:NAD(P)-dependent oxidoreductase [Pseudomonas lalkuanensis]QEY63066.1 NAD(P)-dependent oxidoreductase [Pseudomonas lalkuanensis]
MSHRFNLGWIGLGQMGAPMAERLLGEEVNLHVFDLDPEVMGAFVDKGAVAHASPQAVADAAEIVFACLPDPSVSERVAFGPDGVATGRKIRLYVETSTIGNGCIQAIGIELAKSGIVTIDGPISGGAPAAREGRLTMMVSGDPDAVAEVTPWLSRIGRQVTCLGPRLGQAQIMKLVNNMVMAANMVVASEGLSLGSKAGLDVVAMMEVLMTSTGSSRALTEILVRALHPGTDDFGAHLSIVQKDVSLGISEATALGISLPALDAVRGVWTAAAAGDLARQDLTCILRYIEQQAGTEVRAG